MSEEARLRRFANAHACAPGYLWVIEAEFLPGRWFASSNAFTTKREALDARDDNFPNASFALRVVRYEPSQKGSSRS